MQPDYFNRRSVGLVPTATAWTTCDRFGGTFAGLSTKRTPISLARRQTTSHFTSIPSRSMMSSKESGIFAQCVDFILAPEVEMSRTMQGIEQ